MRYFSFNAFDGDNHVIETISEDEFRRDIYPTLHQKALARDGVDYHFEDILESWTLRTPAWLSD